MIASAIPGHAQTSNVEWQQYDVIIDVQEDGTLTVTERQEIEFTGRFSNGSATIPLDRVEEIDNVQVAVSSDPDADPEPLAYLPPEQYTDAAGTYTTWTSSGNLELDYGFEPTSAGTTETRYVDLMYDVDGGIRVYEDLDPANQQLWWIAIDSLVTEMAPVQESTVTVTLPESVPMEETVIEPEAAEADGQTFAWTASGLDMGDAFEVRLQFPPILNTTEPAWQASDDQLRQQQEEQAEQDAVAGTLSLLAAGLIAVGGGAGIATIWYTRGRDPEVGPVAEYLPEPPDDLHPGTAGVLVNEKAEPRDVVATVLDLARRGVIKMDDSAEERDGVVSSKKRYLFTLQEHDEQLEQFERILIRAIFGARAKPGATASMTDVQRSFAKQEDRIHAGFYDELVAHTYYEESPETVRKRWNAIGTVIPFVGVGLTILIAVVTGGGGGWIFAPIVAALILMVVTYSVGHAMPRKTVAGAEAAAKWEAFKNYLQQIDRYENLEEKKEIFDRYLPYAVAFGVEGTWVHKFSQVDTPMPRWFGMPIGGPHRVPRRRGMGPMVYPVGIPRSGQAGGGSGGGGGGMNVPNPQDMSDSAGRSLQGGSDSLFGMLNTASDVFRKSAGGSGSGTGSFGSWSGGGGSFGGFSGGGSFGGGGGGGGRGFR